MPADSCVVVFTTAAIIGDDQWGWRVHAQAPVNIAAAEALQAESGKPPRWCQRALAAAHNHMDAARLYLKENESDLVAGAG